ncbi:hypothetical protein BGZ61DRAFT_517826 [Ilyonectria robusta]|uniref:uncharacterized protein n=1 Tax=Ilyonectria robusta TaxID=1079257 RepID=UPI001E8D757C|nr:uncharacterized protein BGZ61DRAFT_517826 [Ilyonectria robusta]KAH8699950.1 hypothetical protein BGZ61DRAFT_517826 [Ilyonectria robusta]
MPCKWARPCFGISAGIWDMTSEIAAAQCGSLAEGSLAVAVLRACGLVGLAVNGRERRVDDARNYTLRRGGHAFWRPDSGAICNLSEGCLGQSSAATHVLTRRDIQRWTKVTGEESRWEERGEAKRSANSSIRPQPARIALTVGLEEASERRTGDGLIVAARGGERKEAVRRGAEWIEQKKKPFPMERVSQWDEPTQLVGLVQGDAARHPRLPALSVCARRRTRKESRSWSWPSWASGIKGWDMVRAKRGSEEGEKRVRIFFDN